MNIAKYNSLTNVKVDVENTEEQKVQDIPIFSEDITPNQNPPANSDVLIE